VLCKEEPASFILSHYSHSDTVLYGAQHIERLSSEGEEDDTFMPHTNGDNSINRGEESNKRTCVCKCYVLMRALHNYIVPFKFKDAES